jgi:hypothetical protein
MLPFAPIAPDNYFPGSVHNVSTPEGGSIAFQQSSRDGAIISGNLPPDVAIEEAALFQVQLGRPMLVSQLGFLTGASNLGLELSFALRAGAPLTVTLVIETPETLILTRHYGRQVEYQASLDVSDKTTLYGVRFQDLRLVGAEGGVEIPRPPVSAISSIGLRIASDPVICPQEPKALIEFAEPELAGAKTLGRSTTPCISTSRLRIQIQHYKSDIVQA